MLALLYAELPAMVEEAAEQTAQQLYGEQAGSALRFLAAQKQARGNAALASAVQEIRDSRLFVFERGPRPLVVTWPGGLRCAT